MKKILNVIVVLLAMVAILSGRAEAAVNSFKDITSYTSGEEFRIVMAFSGTPKPIVKYYEKSIQIDIADAHVSPAKRVFDVNHVGIKSINVYQANPNLLRIRIFPSEGIKELKESFSSSVNHEKLVFSVGPKGAALLPVTEKLTPQEESASKTAASNPSAMPETPKAAIETPVMAEEAAKTEEKTEPAMGEAPGDDKILANIQKSLDEIKKEDVKTDGQAVSAPKIQQAGMLGSPEPSQVPGMGEAFIKIGSALMIVLALILAISYGAKKFLGVAEGGLGTKKQMKILSSHFIGVKKNVTIIEVAGEVLVLGVTNNNVNLLARYTDPEKIELIKMTHRLPDRPMGVFKKLPMFGWMKKKQPVQRPVNPMFARQVASYAENMKEAADAKEVKEKKPEIETRKDEMVSSVARSIADRLRTMEEAAS